MGDKPMPLNQDAKRIWGPVTLNYNRAWDIGQVGPYSADGQQVSVELALTSAIQRDGRMNELAARFMAVSWGFSSWRLAMCAHLVGAGDIRGTEIVLVHCVRRSRTTSACMVRVSLRRPSFASPSITQAAKALVILDAVTSFRTPRLVRQARSSSRPPGRSTRRASAA